MNGWLYAGCAALITMGAALWTRRAARRLFLESARLSAKTAELAHRDQASAELEVRYRDLFESVPLAIIVSHMDGRLIDINRAAVQLFGYGRREDMMLLNTKALYANPAERDRRVNATLADPAPKAGELLQRRKDGSTFPALAQLRVIRDPSGTPDHIEGFVTDLSDYKRLEEERRDMEHEQRISQRLKSVGALAAGIAHEINTPMQFVSDSVYFLKTAVTELDVLWPELAELSSESQNGLNSAGTIQRIEAAMSQIDVTQLAIDANQSAERALDGIRRVTKIIRAMREFAHPDNGEHTRVDINNAIETTLTVCKNVYKEVAEVQTDFGPLPLVMCQYGEINQVFLNIVVNAAHAIEAQKRSSERGMIRVSTAVEETWAVIRIQDNGTGIPESVKARIFDPFFTTKEVGKGTGQGLAIVQSVIVERHRGRITVDSEVGKGTTFILRLPLEDQDIPSKGIAHEQEA